MSKSNEVARAFLSEVNAAGFSAEVRDGIITVRKRFTPGDAAAFVAADGLAFNLMAHVPAGSGSVWGTDGGSVGGHAALTHGHYYLNKSGVKKRFLVAVSRILAQGNAA